MTRKSIRIAASFAVITFSTMTALPALAEPLKVLATFSIIGDFARNVGGDRIALTTLIGPNGDAHAYEPKPADAALVSRADVVLTNGLHFEGFIDRLMKASATKARVVELARGATTLEMSQDGHGHPDGGDDGHDHAAEGEHGHDHDGHEAHAGHDHGPIDPHAFQSVANAKVYVKNIAGAFCAADAAGCDAYEANATAYLAKLDALDAELKQEVASIPADRRVIITSHDAFGYFARDYGITFLAPEGISTEAEPSAADIARLIRQVREDNAAAIFVENITNQRLIEQISSETGLKIGGTLYSDALSDADGPAATYIDMMKSNIGVIRNAIAGS